MHFEGHFRTSGSEILTHVVTLLLSQRLFFEVMMDRKDVRMKKGDFVNNRKHFITKKSSYTEGALSAAFPQLFFIEITRSFFF